MNGTGIESVTCHLTDYAFSLLAYSVPYPLLTRLTLIKRFGGFAGTKCQNLKVLLLPAKGYIISFHPILPSQKRIFIWKTFREPLLGLFLRPA